MIIRGASLANRFYKSDGWTHSLVFALLDSVMGEKPNYLHVDLVEDRGDYYAVYSRHCVFDAKKVVQHEYEPYSEYGCDQLFSQKNKVTE